MKPNLLLSAAKPGDRFLQTKTAGYVEPHTTELRVTDEAVGADGKGWILVQEDDKFSYWISREIVDTKWKCVAKVV